MVVYLLIFFCYDLNSASSSSLFSFIFTTYVNCALNAFWCCTSLRVELKSTFSNRLYLPITKFIDPLCSASKIIILCVQCDFTSVFILKDDLRDTTQNWLFSGGSFILLGFRPVRLRKLSVIQNGTCHDGLSIL